jgi:chitin disaccharide deacetylase
MRFFTLCADDFGLSPEISRGIMTLLTRNRLQATSCMTNAPDWARSGPALRDLPPHCQIGLHLTFTEIAPLGAMPILAPNGVLPDPIKLWRGLRLGQTDIAEIRAEMHRQFENFVQIMGRPPSHLDGHHHVHGFPILRDMVLELATEYGCAVRNSSSRWIDIAAGRAHPAKALILNSFSSGLLPALKNNNVRHNTVFYGLHGFSPQRDIGALFLNWARHANLDTLINCHPAQSLGAGDPLAARRLAEFEFFSSERWKPYSEKPIK